MGTLSFLILSIICAGSQHEILATSSDSDSPRSSSPRGASMSAPIEKAWIITGPPLPEMDQGIRFLYMDNPTLVELVSPDKNGRYTRITGYGLAVHPHFVAVRMSAIHRGCKIKSYYVDNKIKYYDIEHITPSPKDKVVLLYTEGLILLDNGHRLQDGFVKYKYSQREYDWVKFTVNNWIAENTLPIRHYRGEDD